MIGWNSLDIRCKNEWVIFTRWISFTGSLLEIKLPGRIELVFSCVFCFFFCDRCNKLSYWNETLAIPDWINNRSVDFNETESCPYTRDTRKGDGSILGTFALEKY